MQCLQELLRKRSCPLCGEGFLYWFQIKETRMQNGSLNLHEVDTSLVLGCESCGETLDKISVDQVAELLTNEL